MPKLAPVEPIDNESTDTSDNDEALAKDVYAFIVVAPIASKPFLFAFYVILLKYTIYCLFFFDDDLLKLKQDIHEGDVTVMVVKFFLIPVAVSMQDDLVHVYAFVANVKYDEKILKISQSANKGKYFFSILLRFIDGACSLGVNFYVMLITGNVKGVFLNFAALHFLQSIDEVFFVLVEKGFLGDAMEHMSNLCTQVTLPRRTINNGCVKQLDSILYALTFLICATTYVLWITIWQ